MKQALSEPQERDEKIFKQSATIYPKNNIFSLNTTDFFLIQEAWIKALPACIPASAGAQPTGLSSGGSPGRAAGEPGRGQNSLYTQVQA